MEPMKRRVTINLNNLKTPIRELELKMKIVLIITSKRVFKIIY